MKYRDLSPDMPESSLSSSVGLLAIALVELVDTPCGVDELLLAGEERVALGADTDLVFRTGGFDFPDLAASADDLGRTIVRMDILFHCFSPEFFIVEKIFIYKTIL